MTELDRVVVAGQEILNLRAQLVEANATVERLIEQAKEVHVGAQAAVVALKQANLTVERVTRLEYALINLRTDLYLNLKCKFPPDDGSDDNCGKEDCLLCASCNLIEEALTPKKEPNAPSGT